MALSLYILTYDISAVLPLRLAELGILVSLAITIASATIEGAGAVLLGPLVTLSSVVIIASTLEVALRLAPFLQPPGFGDFIAADDLQGQQALMVRYLDESPWATFRPNTRIRSQGYRGTQDQFTYEWVTDQFGFKNSRAIADQTPIDVVALGDSFTEGMGVPEQSTWPAHLTKLGLSTYNLGVQGYSPSQLAGVLKRYGLDRKPSWVVVEYTSTTFQREALFSNQQGPQQTRGLAGGIQSVANADIRGEVRDQSRVRLSALYLLLRDVTTELRGGLSVGVRRAEDLVNPAFDPYKREIVAVGGERDLMESIENASLEWTSTLSAFEEIIEKSRASGARILLVYLPNRGEVYYSFATGRNLPDEYLGQLESDRLRDFAAEHGISFVDPSDRLRDYVDSILPALNDVSLADLPFLEVDGHPSSIGYELIANEIARAIRGGASAANSSGTTH